MSMQDSQARQKAVEQIGQSFIVRAPAGSGKTEILIGRYLNLLAHCNEIEEVLAITFTNKAADEMKARIIQGLKQAYYKETPQEQHKLKNYNLALQVLANSKNKNWNIMDNLHKFKISTNDSFFLELCKQNIVDTNLPNNFKISNDAQFLYEKAVNQLFNKTIKEIPALKKPFENLFNCFNNQLNQLKQTFIVFLKKRDIFIDFFNQIYNQQDVKSFSDQQNNFIQIIRDEKINIFIEHINKLFNQEQLDIFCQIINEVNKSHLEPLFDRGIHKSELNSNCEHLLSLWLEIILPFFLTKDKKKSRAKYNSKLKINNKETETLLKRIFNENKDIFKSLFNETDDNPIQTLLTQINQIEKLNLFFENQPSQLQNNELLFDFICLFRMLLAHLLTLFSQHKLYDFTEINFNTRALLQNKNEYFETSLKKINHILLDEFQDTSPFQLNCFELLVENWDETTHKTVFIVGDPMQSIYMFRKADVRIFLKLWSEKRIKNIALEPLVLLSNFRSKQSTVEAINHLCKSFMDSKTSINESAIEFIQSQATNSVKIEQPIELLISENEEKQLELILSKIVQIKQDNPQTSIAVLVKAKDSSRTLIAKLKELKINFVASDIEVLENKSVIVSLLCILKCLLFNSKLYFAQLLRISEVGLDFDDIETILNSLTAKNNLFQQLKNFKDYEQLTQEGTIRLKNLQSAIQYYDSQMSIYQIEFHLYQFWLDLIGELIELKNYYRYTQIFFELLKDCEYNHQFELEQLEYLLNKQTVSIVFKPNPKQVSIEIMTIHKAKGLEFDYVFLPFLYKKNKSDLENDNIVRAESFSLSSSDNFYNLTAFKNKKSSDNFLYDFLKDHQQIKKSNETKRLLYVALTRAANKIFISYPVKNVTNNNFKNQILNNFEFTEKQIALIDEITNLDNQTDKSQIPTPNYLSNVNEANDYYRVKLATIQKNTLAQSSKLIALPLKVNSSNLDSTIGSILHKIIEYIELSDSHQANEYCQNTLIKYESYMQLQFQNSRLNECEIEQARLKINQQLKKILVDINFKWIKQKREQSFDEYMLYEIDEEEGIKKRYIDKCFIEDEYLWIVDYKSDKLGNIDKDIFIKQAYERHKEQLNNYGHIMKLRGFDKIKLCLYFLDLPHLHSWDY